MDVTIAKALLSETPDSELLPLLRAHWEEIGRASGMGTDLAFDRETHARLEKSGKWVAFGVRDPEGRLVGYAAFFLSKHPFITGTVATMEVLYLSPAFRIGFTASRLLHEAERELKNSGAACVQYSAPVVRDCSALFKRLGAKQIESLWRKEL